MQEDKTLTEFVTRFFSNAMLLFSQLRLKTNIKHVQGEENENYGLL